MNSMEIRRLRLSITASQARKRMKGHGFGVQSIEADGRRGCVVIHTATGDHERDLKSFFADAIDGRDKNIERQTIENLRNLGPTSAAWLKEAGIYKVSELRAVGPAVAFLRVREQQSNVSYNLLWAMIGALSNRDWRKVTEPEKKKWKLTIKRITDGSHDTP